MAILLLKIENKESLTLNEFFDYNGHCYAISRNRDKQGDVAIDMADFFEASVRTQELSGITVVFVYGESDCEILGWYRQAVISKTIKRPSIFLEGNIIAQSSDAVLLPEDEMKYNVSWQEKKKLYEVVEQEDRRYQSLCEMVELYEGENAFLRYPYVEAKMIPSAIKSVEACNEACEYYASKVLNNGCKSILEIKLLETYGKKLSEMDSKSADGYYYLAMAQCQLGFEKKAIKAIEKALKLEPEASDLIAQKGIILCSMGHDRAAADCFVEAFDKSHDEQYLILRAVAHMRSGEMDKGYECLKSIEDESLLEESGIQLNYMEKRWSFASLGRLLFDSHHSK